MRLLLALLFVPLTALAQSGSIGGGAPPPPFAVPTPPMDSETWRGSGSGRSVMSKLDACQQARKDGNSQIDLQTFRLRGMNRIPKSSSMSDCSCEGPAPGGWNTCMVEISISHSNR